MGGLLVPSWRQSDWPRIEDRNLERRKNPLIRIPDPGEEWRALLSRIPSSGSGVYFIVGGWVRDLFLLGPRGVRSDIDLVTDGDLSGWTHAVSKEFGCEPRIEPDFLTARIGVTLEGLGLVRIDMSQFRREDYDFPGALPRVFPGSMREDLLRRDFTMNAIMLEWSVSLKKFTRIIDPFDGRTDLKKSRIKLVRPRSLKEDPTRILRWARLSVRLGLKSEESLEGEIRSSLAEPVWDSVGKARIGREMDKMLQEPDPLGVLVCLSDSGVLSSLTGIPSLSAPRRLRLRRWALFRESILRAREGLGRDPLAYSREMFYLGFFFGMTRAQFAFSTARLGLGEKLKGQIQRSIFEKTTWPFRRFYHGFHRESQGRPGEMMALADGLGFTQVLLLVLLAPENHLPFWKKYLESDRGLPPLLKGEDLIGFPGIPPAQRGRILSEVRILQRTGKLASHEEAMDWLRKRISEGFP